MQLEFIQGFYCVFMYNYVCVHLKCDHNHINTEILRCHNQLNRLEHNLLFYIYSFWFSILSEYEYYKFVSSVYSLSR